MTGINGSSDNRSSLLNWLGLFLALNLAWLLLAAFTAWLGWRSFNLSANGSVAEGTVVRLLEDEVSATSDFYPVVEFEVDGQTYSVQSQNSYRWWNRYLRFPVGGQVEILYDPADPEKAEINSWWDIWNEPLILGVFTVIAAIGVNVYLLYRWRSRRKTPLSSA
jgi:hypothetical protein